MSLESTARINSLISAANATTGNADKDLTNAVGSLIAGFGQGGSGGSGSVETVAVTISAYSHVGTAVHYTDSEHNHQEFTIDSDDFTTTLECAKGSPVIFYSYGFSPSIEADVQVPYDPIASSAGMYVYYFDTDTSISISNSEGW